MAEGLSLSSYQGDSFVLNVQILASCMPACALYFPVWLDFLPSFIVVYFFCGTYFFRKNMVIAYIYVRVDKYLFVCSIT